MKSICALLTFAIFAMVLGGCSASGNPAMAPSVDPVEIRESSSEHMMWGFWDIGFDQATGKVDIVPLRVAEGHINITPFLTPPECADCLGITVISFDPDTRILDVDVDIKNPYPFGGYDVRGILFTNEFGHRLTNPDDWTPLFDVAGGMDINPFRAFAKGEPLRKFAGFAQHKEKYLIYIPQPPNYIQIKYAVTTSYPDNCRDAYSIDNFGQTDLYDITGYQADISIDVFSWDNSVDEVLVYAEEITGDMATELSQGFQPFHWYGSLENNAPAGEGDYEILAEAITHGTTDISLFDYVTVTVTESPAPVITEIIPDIAGLGHFLEDVIIKGENFLVPSEVKLKMGETEIIGTNVEIISSETIVLDIEIPLEAETGSYDVLVINPGGMIGTGVSMFTVTAQKDGWVDTWGGEGYDEAWDTDIIIVDSSPRFHVAGTEDWWEGTAFSGIYSSGGVPWPKQRWGDGVIGSAFVTSMHVDQLSGYTYVAGGFSGTVDFDPSPDTEDFHTSNGMGMIDAFITLFNASGMYMHSITWGGADEDVVHDIYSSSDGTSIYLAGYFSDIVEFGEGPASKQVVSEGGTDAILCRYSYFLAFEDCVAWGSTEDDMAFAVKVTEGGFKKIFVAGTFGGTVDFDPGDGIMEETSNGDLDCYLTSFDEDLNYIDAVTWGGTEEDIPYDIGLNPPTEVYVCGFFGGEVDFDPSDGTDEFTSYGGNDAYVCKYDHAGSPGSFEYDETHRWGSYGDDVAFAMAMWANGYYVTGWFKGEVDFDPSGGLDLHTSGYYEDAYLSSFNAADGFNWARTWGADGFDAGLGVAALENTGLVSICGFFEGEVDFDPGPGEEWHTAVDSVDAFLSVFPSTGLW